MIGGGPVEALEGPADYAAVSASDEKAVDVGALDEGAAFVAVWICYVGA